jgi:hypothetical protein
MGVKASEVGDWLRQRTGKRDHREAMSGNHLVLRPGPNFHLLNPVITQPPVSAPEQSQMKADRREAGSPE